VCLSIHHSKAEYHEVISKILEHAVGIEPLPMSEHCITETYEDSDKLVEAIHEFTKDHILPVTKGTCKLGHFIVKLAK